MEVLVFKTNISYDDDLELISPLLNEHPMVLQWNVDREDIDKVLRIEAKEICPDEMINVINKAGYFCEELPD